MTEDPEAPPWPALLPEAEFEETKPEEEGGGRGWFAMLLPVPKGMGAKLGSFPLELDAFMSTFSSEMPSDFINDGGRLDPEEKEAARSTPGKRSLKSFALFPLEVWEPLLLELSGGRGSSEEDVMAEGRDDAGRDDELNTPGGRERPPRLPDPDDVAEDGRMGDDPPLRPSGPLTPLNSSDTGSEIPVPGVTPNPGGREPELDPARAKPKRDLPRAAASSIAGGRGKPGGALIPLESPATPLEEPEPDAVLSCDDAVVLTRLKPGGPSTFAAAGGFVGASLPLSAAGVGVLASAPAEKGSK